MKIFKIKKDALIFVIQKESNEKSFSVFILLMHLSENKTLLLVLLQILISNLKNLLSQLLLRLLFEI